MKSVSDVRQTGFSITLAAALATTNSTRTPVATRAPPNVYAALAAYREAHQILRRQLGAGPGAELIALRQAMLERSPSLDRPRNGSSGGHLS